MFIVAAWLSNRPFVDWLRMQVRNDRTDGDGFDSTFPIKENAVVKRSSQLKLAWLSLALAGALDAGAAPRDAELVALVQGHVQAQSTFDVAALKALTAEDYVEISPLGEVDSRDKMLAFYAPEKKRPAPQVQVDEPMVRIAGDTAIVYARLTFTMQADGAPRSFAIRGGYVARYKDSKWQLVSAQYTGIRPPKN